MSLDEELFDAVLEGDVERVRELLRMGASVKARSVGDLTPLHYAASRGYVDIAKLLLEHGADVNARDMDGWTPLHAASFCGHAYAAGLLLDHGADPSIRDYRGRTPLDFAREKGHEEVARVIEEFVAQGRRGREVGVVATPTTVSAQELVAVAPSILGVESPVLYVGKWGRLHVRLRGSGTATLSLEGDVEWLDPGRVKLSGEAIIEVPVRSKTRGELPVRVVVKSPGGEDAKITWLKVAEKVARCPSCGEPILPGAKYCWNCGAKLS
jgi:hypothetical protein